MYVCMHACMFKCIYNIYHYFQGVTMAARGLIQLFRELNPSLLHKRDRVISFCVACIIYTYIYIRIYTTVFYLLDTDMTRVSLLHVFLCNFSAAFF